MTTKYIVVIGGVYSGIGKGIISSSIGKITTEHGFTTVANKIDPYLNIDAGTLRPTEHGEVWVTSDGAEVDQDLGNYERFLNRELSKKNSITTGQIYRAVLEKERNGYYGGKTVETIPHVTDEIESRIINGSLNNDISVVEVGGIVGDEQNRLFFKALSNLAEKVGDNNMVFVLVAPIMVPSHLGEPKTKPIQTSTTLLNSLGIRPDFIICRGKGLDDVRKSKIEIACRVKKENIIEMPDVKSTYQVPLVLENQNFSKNLFTKLKLTAKKPADWTSWSNLINIEEKYDKEVKIAIVGKYIDIGEHTLKDSYLSIEEAIKHASAHLKIKILIDWIDSKSIKSDNVAKLSIYAGVIVPGGFGSDGTEGKITVINYLRTNNIPFLGICYGMQLAVVEFARHVCGLDTANTTEVNKDTKYPVVDILDDQKQVTQIGGTMRLGAYECKLKSNTVVHNLYKHKMSENWTIYERHRHRYEVNPLFVKPLEAKGLVFSGSYRDNGKQVDLMEFVELSDHKFFVATQAHPEFTSTLTHPNPLFIGFVKAL